MLNTPAMSTPAPQPTALLFFLSHQDSYRKPLFSKKEVFARVAGMCRDTSEDLSAIAPKLRGYAAKQLALYEANERSWTERRTCSLRS